MRRVTTMSCCWCRLNGCGVTTLPEELSAAANTLLSLDIGGCPMTEFPDVIFRLTSLEKLIVTNVAVLELPEAIGASLKHIKLLFLYIITLIKRRLNRKAEQTEGAGSGRLPSQSSARLVRAAGKAREAQPVGSVVDGRCGRRSVLPRVQ